MQNASILQYFQPSLSYHLSLRSLFCLFLSGRFTQILLVAGKESVGDYNLHLILNLCFVVLNNYYLRFSQILRNLLPSDSLILRIAICNGEREIFDNWSKSLSRIAWKPSLQPPADLDWTSGRNFHVLIQRGGGGAWRNGVRSTCWKITKNIGFLSNTGSDRFKITKLPSQHSMLSHHRPASETPFKWRFAGEPLMAR